MGINSGTTPNAAVEMPPTKRMEVNETFVEALIDRIKQHPVLYDASDPNYKDIRLKDQIWDNIASDMPTDTNAIELKKRWKNLRDSYSKYLRAHIGAKARYTANYKSWPWADLMTYFRPYLSFVQKQKYEDDNTESCPLLIRKEQKIKFAKKRKITERPSRSQPEMQNVQMTVPYLEYLGKDTNSNTHDDVDLVFLGYAASVKKLPPRRQTLIKFKVAKLIMEEELNELKQDPLSQDQESENNST